MVRLTNYVAVLPEKMSQVTHLMVKSTNIWVVTRVVHVTYSESVGVTILLVAVSVKFSQATVCNLVGLTVIIVALSVRIVAMLLDWLQQQIPQSSQH